MSLLLADDGDFSSPNAGGNASNSGWFTDAFEDGSTAILSEGQLEGFHRFLGDYANQLQDIEEAIQVDSLSDSWDPELDPIALSTAPFEAATVLDLVQTDNKVFNKVLAVFGAVCSELNELKHEAETKFYNVLLMYGETFEHTKLEEGDVQLKIGRLLPLLQDLSNFVTRVQDVVKNTVQQLGALYTVNKNTRVMD
ncbi:hypothetical protein CAOG_08707, partial [Capsaspora owczarzaki ATCC 30864]